MVLGKQTTVATTATLIHKATTNGCAVIVRNPTGGAAVTLGAAAVVAGAGYTLSGGDAETIPLPPGDSLFGIVAASTQALSVLVIEY